MKIHAARLREAKGGFGVEQVDLEEPRKGEGLVKVSASGWCHSDWHLASGATKHPFPVVSGH